MPARVVIDLEKADKYYIWAFIRSTPGTLQFAREVTGSVQAGINLEDLREVLIPEPHRNVQIYIGDKVRHAERLRERSRELEQKVNLEFLSIGIINEFSFQKYSRISPQQISHRLIISIIERTYLIVFDKFKNLIQHAQEIESIL